MRTARRWSGRSLRSALRVVMTNVRLMAFRTTVCFTVVMSGRLFQESEEPVVDCQVLDSDVSPCRTGSSSMTSGDLGDISSLSSKASSLQHSSGGTSSSAGLARSDFVMPPSRGSKTSRYKLWSPLWRSLRCRLFLCPAFLSCDFLTPSFLSASLIFACFRYKLLQGINLG